jgi:2-keto-4-pentenoate hydratase/2-oxohepta-3-ene-1,7-dioic acid hydratase in catechol pathway
MRLVTFVRSDGVTALGALTADRQHIVDLQAAAIRQGGAQPCLTSMLSLVQSGAAGLGTAREIATRAESADTLPLAGTKLLAPLPVPESVRCFSAFEEHVRRSAQVMLKRIASQSPDPAKAEKELLAGGKFEVPKLFYERPLYYKGNRFSVVGTEAQITWPSYSNVVDFEHELACIIGLRGRDIAKQDTAPYIFGYTVCNDLSARDAQAIEMQAPLGPAKGKDFDGGLAMGPCIVTADEFDRSQATMIVRVNGEEWSRGKASDMYHTFEAMIEYVSRSETLHPGEMLISGCVGGGSGTEHGRYPVRGDTIEMEIHGIGVLRNRIV